MKKEWRLHARRKLEIAERSYELLDDKWGIAPEDIIFDPFVFQSEQGMNNI